MATTRAVMIETDDAWPIDVNSLRKGDSIGPDVLVPFFEVSLDSREYQLKLAGFVARLEAVLWKDGKRYIVRCSHGSASILTDREAAEYTERRFNAHYRGLRRSNRRAKVVDQKKLGAEERRRHEHSLVVQGAILAGAAKGVESLQPTAYKRRNPGLESIRKE